MRWLVLAIGLIGCGGDDEPGPPKDILGQLQSLPGVTAMEWTPPEGFEPEPGYRYYDIWFTQPVDHTNPGAGTFQQYAALMHRDLDAPLVMYTSGYDAGWKRFRTEPATVLDGNQLSLEYRYYAESRPEAIDWSTLTVENNAADEHEVLAALKTIYGGTTFQTGGSKGGETSMFHLMLYPDDLDGAISYVAPVITANPDDRYATVLDDIGPGIPEIDACRNKLRALGREMLARSASMEGLAEMQADYTIAGVAHATETAIVELEFGFWMTHGENSCPFVPETTATDQEIYDFLAESSGPAAYGDGALLEYGQQYIFQDQLQLGYPVWQHAHLDDLLRFSYEDWSAYLPTANPTYDPATSRRLDEFLRGSPAKLIHVGGEWDPWGPGYPPIATSAEALDFRVVHGSHWSSGFYSLTDDERALAVDTLRRWAGLPAMRRTDLVLPVPPASMATRGPAAI